MQLWAMRIAGAVFALAMFCGHAAEAQQKDVKAAVIAPLSGPWARQGQLIKLGAEMAIDEINAKGGIKALGGAKMVLVTADAGDTTEKAKNAAERLLSQEPDLIGGTGAWLSSFTLAVTEVTERAQLPWLTLSYADSITDRGFKFVFQTSPTAGRQSTEALPTIMALAEKASGGRPKTVGILSDNTASSVGFTKPMREGGLEKLGLKLVMDEVFTPPLSDATPLIQKLRSAKPDFLLFLPSNVPDDKLLLEKLHEFRLDNGRIPLIGSGTHLGTPELLKVVGPELLEGLMVITANWGLKGSDALAEQFKKRTGEPWITQDSITGYGDMWILKEAVERAGVADRIKVAEQIRKMHETSGVLGATYPGGVQFDERGRMVGAPLVIIQWQKGVPVSVYPTDRALAKPYWPKS